jgi:hypothetical protein
VTDFKTCRENLLVVGATVPEWSTLQDGGRPDVVVEEIREPGVFKHGWQHKVAKDVDLDFKRQCGSVFSCTEKAHILSQGGLGVSATFTAMPTSRLTKLDSDQFRVLLLRCFR